MRARTPLFMGIQMKIKKEGRLEEIGQVCVCVAKSQAEAGGPGYSPPQLRPRSCVA